MRKVKFVSETSNIITTDRLVPLASYIAEQGLKTINDLTLSPVMDDFCSSSNYIVMETRANLPEHGIYIGNMEDSINPELVTDDFGNITLIFHRK
jgi:hypothetical protein